MTTKTLTVPDISCEHCERAIKGALEPLAGVKSVQVSIPTKRVTVEYDEAQVGVDEFKKAVDEEGYSVARVE